MNENGLRILVTRRWPAAAEHYLAERYDAAFNTEDIPLAQETLSRAFDEYDVICPTVSDKIDAAVIGAASPLERRPRVSCSPSDRHEPLGPQASGWQWWQV